MASFAPRLRHSAPLQIHRLTQEISRRTQRSVTSYTQKEYVIRRATDADYDAIKDVSRQAHNHGYKSDYMAGMLSVYMRDEHRVIHVVQRTKDNKILGSAMALGGLDQGVTFHGEAGRSIPSYQNRGLLNDLMSSINTDVSSRWPVWDHFKGSSTQTHFYDTIMDKIDLQVTRFALRIRVDRSQLEQYLTERDDSRWSHPERSDSGQSQPSQPPQPVTSPDLCRLLNDDYQRRYYYPEGYLVVEHNIMEAHHTNVHFVTDYHGDMIISGDVTARDAALSIGGRMTVNDDKSWRYNVNYTGAPSVYSCDHHLRHMLRHNMDSLSEREETFVVLMMPITVRGRYGEEELIKFWGTRFGVEREHITPLTQYCFKYLKGVRDRLTSPSDIKRKQEAGARNS